MSVYCECCVSSGRDLCVGLITSPEESHRLRCVVMCDLETSWMRRPCPTGCCCAPPQKKSATLIIARYWMKYSNGKFSGLLYRNKINLFLRGEVVKAVIPNLGTGWRWVGSFTTRPLCCRERILVYFEWETGWAPYPFWAFWGRNPTRIIIILEQRLSTKQFLCLCKNCFVDTHRLRKNA